jgi:hypothetical protein
MIQKEWKIAMWSKNTWRKLEQRDEDTHGVMMVNYTLMKATMKATTELSKTEIPISVITNGETFDNFFLEWTESERIILQNHYVPKAEWGKTNSSTNLFSTNYKRNEDMCASTKHWNGYDEESIASGQSNNDYSEDICESNKHQNGYDA